MTMCRLARNHESRAMPKTTKPRGNAEPRPHGRPSLYSDAIAAAICGRLGTGETLQAICRDEHMPAVRTVNEWTERMPEFSADFARARLRGFDAIAAEALAIADSPLEGVETIIKADGSTEVRRSDILGHRKLQIETRLKLLDKWDPKRYGERTVLAGDAQAPLALAAVSVTPEEYRRIAAEVAAKT